MQRKRAVVLYPIVAGILFAVGAVRFYMRGDLTGMGINLVAAIASFLVANWYKREEE